MGARGRSLPRSGMTGGTACPTLQSRGFEGGWDRHSACRGFCHGLLVWKSAYYGLSVHGGRARTAQIFKALRRIVVQNPLAALAKQHLLAVLEVLQMLRPHGDVTDRAAAVHNFRHRSAAPAADPLVILVHAGRHGSYERFSQGFTLTQGFLIGLSPLTRLLFLAFHFGFLQLERGFGRFHVLVQRFGFRHQIENSVLRAADFGVTELYFVLKSLVL